MKISSCLSVLWQRHLFYLYFYLKDASNVMRNRFICRPSLWWTSETSLVSCTSLFSPLHQMRCDELYWFNGEKQTYECCKINLLAHVRQNLSISFIYLLYQTTHQINSIFHTLSLFTLSLTYFSRHNFSPKPNTSLKLVHHRHLGLNLTVRDLFD